MELANCFSIPHSALICPFCHLSAQARDDGEVQGGDGTAAACLTEQNRPTATKLIAMVCRGLQQLSVHLGLRRDSHLTGFGDFFILAEPEVFACDLWHFCQTGLGNAPGAAGLGSVMFNKVTHRAKENSFLY